MPQAHLGVVISDPWVPVTEILVKLLFYVLLQTLLPRTQDWCPSGLAKKANLSLPGAWEQRLRSSLSALMPFNLGMNSLPEASLVAHVNRPL